MIIFKFNDTIYMNEQDANQACFDAHPELLDDDMPDFFSANIEAIDAVECEFCGRLVRRVNHTHHILIQHPEEQ